MKLIYLILAAALFASPNAAVILGAASSQTLYEIDVETRGAEIVSTFNVLQPNLTSVNLFYPPLIEMQTILPPSFYASYKGVYSNGIIPYIQNITGSTYNTLLLVTYLMPKYSTQYPFYIVLPVEQITAMLYFPVNYQLPLPSVDSAQPFTASFPPNRIPYYAVNPDHRAADLISMFAQLQALITEPQYNQIWIQTGVVGPYRSPTTPNGLLQNVTAIALIGTGLLQITFAPSDQPPQNVGVVYVTPEQVQQMIFIRYWNNITSP